MKLNNIRCSCHRQNTGGDQKQFPAGDQSFYGVCAWWSWKFLTTLTRSTWELRHTPLQHNSKCCIPPSRPLPTKLYEHQFPAEIISLLCRPWNIHVHPPSRRVRPYTKRNALHFVERRSTTLLEPIWKVQPQIMENVLPTSTRLLKYKRIITNCTPDEDPYCIGRGGTIWTSLLYLAVSFMNNSWPVIFALLHYSRKSFGRHIISSFPASHHHRPSPSTGYVSPARSPRLQPQPDWLTVWPCHFPILQGECKYISMHI